jgi:hypothetical protein
VIAETAGGAQGAGPATATLRAARAWIGLVALLLALAAVGWWWTADRMLGVGQMEPMQP